MFKCPFCQSRPQGCGLCGGHPVPTELAVAYALVRPQLFKLVGKNRSTVEDITEFLRQLRRDVLGDID